jgi:TonB family protein
MSKAVYPQAAKEQKIQGQVVGMILVSENGGVESVHFFKGDPILAAAAGKAAEQWKFRPVTKDGHLVPVIARATFNFALPVNPQDATDVAAELDQVAGFPQSVRVSNGVMRGMIQRKINPSYPEEARRAKIEGTVTMRARINKEGKIGDLQVVSGPEGLVPSAVEAVRQWQYKPYLFMGRPVEVESELQVNFSLR